jgi:hypothetical protein
METTKTNWDKSNRPQGANEDGTRGKIEDAVPKVRFATMRLILAPFKISTQTMD